MTNNYFECFITRDVAPRIVRGYLCLGVLRKVVRSNDPFYSLLLRCVVVFRKCVARKSVRRRYFCLFYVYISLDEHSLSEWSLYLLCCCVALCLRSIYCFGRRRSASHACVVAVRLSFRPLLSYENIIGVPNGSSTGIRLNSSTPFYFA